MTITVVDEGQAVSTSEEATMQVVSEDPAIEQSKSRLQQRLTYFDKLQEELL